MELPKDWVTAHLPHDVQVEQTGLFRRTRVVVCSCGLSGVGKVNMWQLHEQREYKMRAWLESVYKQREKPKNNWYR